MTPLDLISLAQAKEWLKVTFSDEDATITSLIKSAIDQIEKETEQRLYNRPEVIETRKEFYETAIHPITEVTSIVSDGETLVANEDYWYFGDYDKFFEFDNCIAVDKPARVITLDVGYTAGECPETLRVACLNLIEYWFKNRGAADVPPNVSERIAKYRRLTWF